MKIRVAAIDLLAYGMSHLTVNRFWIETLCEKGTIDIYGEKQHVSEISKSSQNAHIKPFTKRPLWRFIRELYFPLIIALCIAKYDRILIMGATGPQHLLLSIIDKIFPKQSAKVTVIFHSELEGLVHPKGISKKLSKFAILRNKYPKNVQGVVLGQHILESLISLGIDRNFTSIEHPLPSIPFASSVPKISNEYLNVALIGLLRGDTKNLETAINLSDDPYFNVSMIGRIGPDFETGGNVSLILSDGHYTDEWMRNKISPIHGLIVSLKEGSYSFTASGTATDSIQYGKILLYVRHPALNKYDDAPFSVCGNNLEDLAKNVKEFSELDNVSCNLWISKFNRTSSDLFLDLMFGNEG